MRNLSGLTLLVLAPLLLLGACERPQAPPTLAYQAAPEQAPRATYRLAIHPLHNPKKLSEAYQPLIKYLNRHLAGVHFELEASRDYQVFEQKFKARKAEFILPNPWQTLQAIPHGYQVIAMAGDEQDFKGLFIVRKDSALRTPADLKGKSVSYPSPTALAACILPQYFLFNHGIDVNRDIRNFYVGPQESSIMNVYLGNTAAGATWPPP